MQPQRCALDETRTARDSRILRNESARLRRALAPRRPRRKGRERHDRTTAPAPRAAGQGHVHFDCDRGLPHLRPHDDARDRHARVAVRGEFLGQESVNDRTVLARSVLLDITPKSYRLEQAYSDDGGKTWEVNSISVHTRIGSR
jgi:hypothetical protein